MLFLLRVAAIAGNLIIGLDVIVLFFTLFTSPVYFSLLRTPLSQCIIDDYATLDECKRAVDEFRAERGISAPMLAPDASSVVWAKQRGEEVTEGPRQPTPAAKRGGAAAASVSAPAPAPVAPVVRKQK